MALCPLPSHGLFGGGSGPYPSDAQVWRAPRGSPITQRRWEALPTGQPPLEAGGSEMAAGSVLGSGLNPMGLPARPSEGLVPASPLQPRRALPRGLACGLARWGSPWPPPHPPTRPSANTQAARGSARPTVDPGAGEARLGPSWPQAIWDLPDPTQAPPSGGALGDLLTPLHLLSEAVTCNTGSHRTLQQTQGRCAGGPCPGLALPPARPVRQVCILVRMTKAPSPVPSRCCGETRGRWASERVALC